MEYTEAQRKALAKSAKAAGIPDALNVFKVRPLERLNAEAERCKRNVVEARERILVNPRDVPKPPPVPMSDEVKELLRRKAEVERSYKPKRPPKPRREDAFRGDEVIRILKANPCRPGTAAHAVFEHYRDGMTVAEFAEEAAPACPGKLRPVDYLIYDSRKGRISVGAAPPAAESKPATKPKAKAKPAPKAKPKKGKKQ